HRKNGEWEWWIGMMDSGFRTFLNNDPKIKSEKAVASRMVKARKAEIVLEMDLDYVVASDDRTYDALIVLRQNEDPAHSPMQNALRKYYIFKNGKEFPQLRYYHE